MNTLGDGLILMTFGLIYAPDVSFHFAVVLGLRPSLGFQI
jgi:hypothetical protein